MHAGRRTRVISMGGLYDAATLHARCVSERGRKFYGYWQITCLCDSNKHVSASTLKIEHRDRTYGFFCFTTQFVSSLAQLRQIASVRERVPVRESACVCVCVRVMSALGP